MEKAYGEYTRLTDAAVKPETIRPSLLSIGKVGHFVKDDGGAFVPRHYPGMTLITPTSADDAAGKPVYDTLKRVQATLADKAPARAVVRAPEDALHMTLARLVSGKAYEALLEADGEGALLKALGALFRKLPPQEGLAFEITGIAAMHGIVAALVSARNENTYRRLQAFRDAVYNDPALERLGVERKRGFTGHITLMYAEDDLTAEEAFNLAEAVIDANLECFPKPMPFNVTRTEARRFDNYLHFKREQDWPVYSFGG